MKGLELSEKYFTECGLPLLESEFSDLLPFLAIGFVGSGSDRYGFDDEISRDHDFEPGFCLFLPDENVVSRRDAFLLERAYAKLPDEFYGFKRQKISPVGGNRNGVIRTADFYLNAVGKSDGNLTEYEWLCVDDFALAEATNGKVFDDNYGEFSKIREILLNMPNDIKLKRIAGNLLIMAQSGQYNFTRCVKRGEYEAAQLAIYEFVKSTIKTVFLLNGKYMPYYKWSFKALRELLPDSQIPNDLSFLLVGDNADKDIADNKYYIIESVASAVIDNLQQLQISKAVCGDLEKHAYSVNDKISDANIRNLNIFAGV